MVQGLHLSARVFWPLWPHSLFGSCGSVFSRCLTDIKRHHCDLSAQTKGFKGELLPNVPVPIWMTGAQEWGDGRDEEGANALVCESVLVWLRLKQWSDGWGTRARVEEEELGGEVEKCVATNSKNEIKRRLNERRPKVQQWMEGLNYVALKSHKDKGGGSGRRINTSTVSGIFGSCMSTEI